MIAHWGSGYGAPPDPTICATTHTQSENPGNRNALCPDRPWPGLDWASLVYPKVASFQLGARRDLHGDLGFAERVCGHAPHPGHFLLQGRVLPTQPAPCPSCGAGCLGTSWCLLRRSQGATGQQVASQGDV